MKGKRIIAVLMSVMLTATAAVSASASDLKNDEGATEITANIEGGTTGEVSYIITIPDKVDFGTLTLPEEDVDSYKYVGFNVEAKELNIKNNQSVSVFVKDSVSSDGQFYLTQKDSASPFSISYDVYDREINSENMNDYTPMNETGDCTEYGYHLCTFVGPDTAGTLHNVTLTLNQKSLYGKNPDDIAGNYSGTMLFHSSLTTFGS